MRIAGVVRWSALVLAVCLIGSGFGAVQARAQTTPAQFVSGPCKFKLGHGIVQGTDVRCGVLVVPESRTTSSGRQLRLAVAIFRTPSAHRRPDPMVFLQGGPGGAIVNDLGSSITRKDAQKYMGDHDLILIDQRGTGLSAPHLTCPEVGRELAKVPSKDPSIDHQIAAQSKGLLECHARLVKKGIDLSAYNTLNDAADIADLRLALGLPQIDLYGVSYGTRVALAVMRYYPAGIRSVVLDSIVPPQYNIFTDSLAAEGRAFNALTGSCKHQSACSRKYPHLKRTFDRLLTRLDRHPLQLKVADPSTKQSVTVRITGDDFAEVVRGAMYITPLIRYLPALIFEVNDGQYRALRYLYGILNTSGGVALGTYKSVTCAEDAPTSTTAALTAASAVVPAAIRLSEMKQIAGELDSCRSWNVAPASPDLRQPVTSAIPTLLLEGEFDPITPPANASAVAATLSHSYSFLFPGTGHGVIYSHPCPDKIIFAFYDDPLHRPASSCIARMTSPFA